MPCADKLVPDYIKEQVAREERVREAQDAAEKGAELRVIHRDGKTFVEDMGE